MSHGGVDSMDERLARRPGLQARLVDDEMVVLDLASGQVHHLNHTASFIWSRFDGKASVAQIGEMVAQEFEVDPGVAARDVGEVAQRLRGSGLLVAEGFGSADQEESHGR
jgi:coenzyme PQQ synthesis protein D (PqqD)